MKIIWLCNCPSDISAGVPCPMPMRLPCVCVCVCARVCVRVCVWRGECQQACEGDRKVGSGTYNPDPSCSRPPRSAASLSISPGLWSPLPASLLGEVTASQRGGSTSLQLQPQVCPTLFLHPARSGVPSLLPHTQSSTPGSCGSSPTDAGPGPWKAGGYLVWQRLCRYH